MNPDVRVLPGCLGALMDALNAGAAVAGPRFYWDEGRRMLLPPAEERSRRSELLALLGGARGGLGGPRPPALAPERLPALGGAAPTGQLRPERQPAGV